MMRFANLMVLLSLLLLDIQAAHAETGQQMLERASKSFSDIAFDTPFKKASASLKIDKVYNSSPQCENGAEDCSYFDRAKVGHYFWFEEPVLVVKTIDIKDFMKRPIRAMGIVNARQKVQVVTNVRAFFGGAKADCSAHVEYGSKTVCTIGLGEGWTKLFFDARNQLVYVRLDAYQFT